MVFELFNQTEKIGEVSRECFNWCKEQHSIHQDNILIGGLGIIIIALISLYLHIFIFNHHNWIQKIYPNLNSKLIEKIFIMSSTFSFYLLIGFLIWFLWLK